MSNTFFFSSSSPFSSSVSQLGRMVGRLIQLKWDMPPRVGELAQRTQPKWDMPRVVGEVAP